MNSNIKADIGKIHVRYLQKYHNKINVGGMRVIIKLILLFILSCFLKLRKGKHLFL